MGRNTRTWAMVIALAVVAPLGITACGGDGGEKPQFGNGSGTTAGATPTPTPPAEPLDFTITPASGAKKQPVSAEIGTKITGGKITDVSLTAAGGGTVKGSMREDGSSWVPAAPLKYSKTYTTKVTATTPTGQSETKTTSFTTMAKPRSVIGSGLYLFDDKTYGVAMPVVVEFSPGIAKKDRAKVQSRMFVNSNPPQPGAWHWVSSGTQAYYRAPEYWQPGTTLTVRIGLEGIPLSNGKYGNVDRKATSKIGSKFEMKVDNKTKKMTVFENDKLVRTIPVSLGKKGTPSSSGKMVVMEKKSSTVFDTRDDPDPSNRYVTEIDFAQRLTWGGEYIHAAPWSVGDQGRRNVSHGCVNVSTPNARWLFEKTKAGDPVTITGTERKLEAGNGWTAWNLSWKDFIKGSALPVPADLGT
jgi:lipoprotein-anchoring transpeptidase ErfK/SrfK